MVLATRTSAARPASDNVGLCMSQSEVRRAGSMLPQGLLNSALLKLPVGRSVAAGAWRAPSERQRSDGNRHDARPDIQRPAVGFPVYR